MTAPGLRFKGHVALVTGAGSGIGRALAVALAGDGASVWLVGRRRALLAAVAERARPPAGEAVCCPADVGVERDVEQVTARLTSEAGRLDLLVHAAGAYARGPVAAATLADLDSQYATNLRGPWSLTRAVLPLLEAASGQVVFVNSTAGLRAAAGVAQYAATKHALRGLADALRDEVNERGIRVLTVFIGRTATPLQAAIHAAEGKPYVPGRLLQPEDVAAIVTAALALPRTAEVTDITIRPRMKA